MVWCGGAGKCCTFSSSNHYPGGIRSVQRGGSVTVFEGCSCASKHAFDPMRLFGANLCDQYLSEVWV